MTKKKIRKKKKTKILSNPEKSKQRFLNKIKQMKEEGTKLNAAQAMQKKFYSGGELLPTCVNEGCYNTITVREWKYQSIKSECSRCSNARKKGVLPKGIKIHKKNFCENRDGHLAEQLDIPGFVCPAAHLTDKEWKLYQESLDLDHLDSDHMNNIPDNVKTYCKLCHNRKSKVEGDWDSTKPSARKID